LPDDAPDGLDEAVHLAVVDVDDGEAMPVRAAVVAVARVVERPAASPRLEVGDADGRDAVPHRDPVGAGVGAEVGVERSVLLHDHHDVPDPVDADERLRRRVTRGSARRGLRPRVQHAGSKGDGSQSAEGDHDHDGSADRAA